MEATRELHPFQRKTLDFILRNRLVEKGERILIAVSGGPDSTALLDCIHSLREHLGVENLTVLHFDHELRGDESTADRAFVEALARELSLDFLASNEDVRSYGKEKRMSLEMAARERRHRFFRQAMEERGARNLALGHTANDQAEELLLRLLRGSGPSGMAGMLPRTDRGIIRPILWAPKRAILQYLNDRDLSYREDSSNLDPFCQRNALRLEVFPALEEYFHGRIAETLSRHAELAADEEEYWNVELERLWPDLCRNDTRESVVLALDRYLALCPALQRRMLRFALQRLRGRIFGIYASHIEVVRNWLGAGGRASGKSIDLPDGIGVGVEGNGILILRRGSSRSQKRVESGQTVNFAPMGGPGSYIFPSVRLDLHIQAAPLPSGSDSGRLSRNIVRMDATKIRWPLFIRFWAPGDRFHPLGLAGTKKLQDFFTDLKIPRSERSGIPLLCDGEKICWVVGYRLDERVRVTPETESVLTVQAHPETTNLSAP